VGGCVGVWFSRACAAEGDERKRKASAASAEAALEKYCRHRLSLWLWWLAMMMVPTSYPGGARTL